MGVRVEDRVRDAIARRAWEGGTQAELTVEFGLSAGLVSKVINERGGLPPHRSWQSGSRNLSQSEREEISRGLVAGCSIRAIARQLGRAPSTISREVARNGGRQRYRAWSGQWRAMRLACRPKPARLATRPRLAAAVEAGLVKGWSPAQIAARLKRDHPDDPEMWVSHETIYQSLYVQGRGALRKELTGHLRTGRAIRRSQARTARPDRRGKIPGMVNISQRPAEVADRAVPGHWEGDLIVGKANASQIATLVERTTRYVLLIRLPTKSAATLADLMADKIATLPAQLRKSMTWDQGCEMADHVRFTLESGMDVYFCDPHSPWQRGTNENTNGLLRQYFPKGTDLSVHTQDHLDAVALELNDRPRKTLGWDTPAEQLTQLLHQHGVAPTP